MISARIHDYGGPEAFVLDETQKPKSGGLEAMQRGKSR